ncbi:MAG: alpha/beta hydrolase [Candidatus Eremiobacteraeota bacterium]|nr:alpha/beta hydrolase [Candidatus Eremiobacteraeota bacterium]
MVSTAPTFIQNGDVSLCLEQQGHGPRHILFAHGWISSRRMWYEVAHRLEPDRYSLHLLDFRGAGLSDRPEFGHDLAGYLSDLQCALESIDAPTTLVAHSMGARIAQYLATLRPPNLERLILVAPGVAKGTRPNEKQGDLAHAAFGSRKKIERFQRAAMAAPVLEQAMERIIDDALVAQKETWFKWFAHGRSEDFSSRLAEIAVPALAIAGEKDPLAPPSRVKRDVAAMIPGCVFLMLRGAGHNLPVEKPQEIAGAIGRF